MPISPRYHTINTWRNYADNYLLTPGDDTGWSRIGGATMRVIDYDGDKKCRVVYSGVSTINYRQVALYNSDYGLRIRQNPVGSSFTFKLDWVVLPPPGNRLEFIWGYWDQTPFNGGNPIIRMQIDSLGDMYLNNNTSSILAKAGAFPLNQEIIVTWYFIDETEYIVLLNDEIITNGGVPFATWNNQIFWPIATGTQPGGGFVIRPTTGAINCHVKLDDIFYYQRNEGLQTDSWPYVRDVPTNGVPSRFVPVHTTVTDHLLLVNNETPTTQVVRVTPDLQTFTNVASLAGLCDPKDAMIGSGYTFPVLTEFVHAYLRHDGATNLAQFAYSTNDGQTFTVFTGPTVGYICAAMVTYWPIASNGGSQEALFLFDNGSTHTIFHRTLSGAGFVNPGYSWVLPFYVAQTPGEPFQFNAVYNHNQASFDVVLNQVGGTNAEYWRIPFGVGAATKIFDFPTNWVVPVNCHQYPILYDHVNNNRICLVLENAGQFRVYESLDDGVSWNIMFEEEAFLLGSSENRVRYPSVSQPQFEGSSTTSDKQNRAWMHLLLSGSIKTYYYDEPLNHGFKLYSDPDTADTFQGASLYGVIFTDLEIFQFDIVPNEIIKRFEFEKWATERPASGMMELNPNDLGIIPEGDFIEIYDGFNQLVSKTKIFEPISTSERSDYELQLVDLNYAVYQKSNFDFKSLNTADMAKTIINGLSFLYQDSSIDPDGDFTLAHNRKVQNRTDKYLQYARDLERAVFYTNPVGLANLRRYDRLIDSGVKWHEGNPQVKLVDVRVPDFRITRSEVSGGHNQAGQVRRVYIGDPGLEASEGTVYVTQKNDPKLMNDAECLQMAVNRFNIYTNEGSDLRTPRIITVRVQNQGHVQVGTTVDFAWKDDAVEIPRKDYMVLAYEPWDVRNDINMVVLTDGIVTLKEITTLARSLNTDDDLTGTYYDGDQESSTNSVPKEQNSVSRLRAGTYVQRLPVPTQYDYYKIAGGATVALPVPNGEPNTWNPIDLSGIVPVGARAVNLKVLIRDNQAGNFMLFGRNGDNNLVSSSIIYSNPSNNFNSQELTVPLDDNRFIEWYSNTTLIAWTEYFIVVIGWWI